MDNIELDNLGEDRTEQEQAERVEEEEEEEEEEAAETSFINRIRGIWGQTNSQIRDSAERTERGDFDLTDVERQTQRLEERKATQRYNAIQALESATGTRFSVTHGDSSKELIDNISDAKYSEKGNLIALKYKGEDVKLTKKGELDKRSAKTYNKDILKAIEKAKIEYVASVASVVNDSVDISLSDEAVESVQESVYNSLEDLVWDKYDEISQNDQDKNIEREINEIPHVDDNVDYDDLEDSNQKAQYDAKIAGLEANIEHWEKLEDIEQDPDRKLLYKTSKELCIAKKSYMEVKAGFRPESEEALSMIQ